ncbi:MAG: glycosyltransferase [Planctomycetes bacterium]|nr:glycosyltransferase [Planctomycetota bacterium]
MKVAFVSQLDPQEFQGGTELVVRATLRALAARGHDVRLVVGTQRPSVRPELVTATLDGIPVVRVPRLAHEVYDLEILRPRLAHAVLEAVRGVDIVHVHHWFTLSSNLARTLSEEAPVVITLHDAFATCPRFFRRSPDPALACPPPDEFAACARCVAPDAPGIPAGELERRLAARARSFAAELTVARAVLAPSRAHAAALAPYVQRASVRAFDRIQVIEPGLCRELARVARPDGAATAPLVVLHFGNLSEAKGTLDLVRALAPFPPGAFELRLLGPALEPDLGARIERDRGALAVRRQGAYGERELEAAAVGAALGAFPSRLAESYGLVVDESLALGLPSWVSDRGALGERLHGAGRVLPAGDVAAWTAAFEALRSLPSMLDEEQRRIPPQPRRAADAAAELEALYVSIAGARRR